MGLVHIPMVDVKGPASIGSHTPQCGCVVSVMPTLILVAVMLTGVLSARFCN